MCNTTTTKTHSWLYIPNLHTESACAAYSLRLRGSHPGSAPWLSTSPAASAMVIQFTCPMGIAEPSSSTTSWEHPSSNLSFPLAPLSSLIFWLPSHISGFFWHNLDPSSFSFEYWHIPRPIQFPPGPLTLGDLSPAFGSSTICIVGVVLGKNWFMRKSFPLFIKYQPDLPFLKSPGGIRLTPSSETPNKSSSWMQTLRPSVVSVQVWWELDHLHFGS